MKNNLKKTQKECIIDVINYVDAMYEGCPWSYFKDYTDCDQWWMNNHWMNE